jgi:hypothetical protein
MTYIRHQLAGSVSTLPAMTAPFCGYIDDVHRLPRRDLSGPGLTGPLTHTRLLELDAKCDPGATRSSIAPVRSVRRGGPIRIIPIQARQGKHDLNAGEWCVRALRR